MQEQKTYADDNGIELLERRRKGREDDDARIAHLFEGFDNVIRNADAYWAGYTKAMRKEFGELVANLVR